MASPEQVQDAELRGLLEAAHRLLREGNGTDSVRRSAQAYLLLLEKHPRLLEQFVEPLPGARMPAVLRWPALGANLVPDSVLEGRPRIDFVRTRFTVSEAITYYEYALETAINAGA